MQEKFNTSLDDLLIETPHEVAVAVSGGADSFALLHLTLKWAQERDIAVTALTVDHKLRAASTKEAKQVAAWCAKNKISHDVLNWDGKKPKTGLQDAARNKRRELLFAACSKRHIPVLLMGHQADDQVETVLMRLQRGTGLQGLTGIPPVSYDHQHDVTLVRPLLEMRRETLRKYAKAKKLPIVDDPSNDDPVFERAALRKTLKQLPDLADGVIKTVERLTRVDWALMNAAAQCFTNHRELTKSGVWLPASLFVTFEDEICQRVAEEALMVVDNDADIPLAGLEQLARNLKVAGFKGQTLAGSAIRPKVWKKQKGYLFEPAPPRKV